MKWHFPLPFENDLTKKKRELWKEYHIYISLVRLCSMVIQWRSLLGHLKLFDMYCQMSHQGQSGDCHILTTLYSELSQKRPCVLQIMLTWQATRPLTDSSDSSHVPPDPTLTRMMPRDYRCSMGLYVNAPVCASHWISSDSEVSGLTRSFSILEVFPESSQTLFTINTFCN